MLSKLRGFVSRHKKKFILGGVIIVGGIAVRYAQRKLVEYQEKVISFSKLHILHNELCTFLKHPCI